MEKGWGGGRENPGAHSGRWREIRQRFEDGEREKSEGRAPGGGQVRGKRGGGGEKREQVEKGKSEGAAGGKCGERSEGADGPNWGEG